MATVLERVRLPWRRGDAPDTTVEATEPEAHAYGAPLAVVAVLLVAWSRFADPFVLPPDRTTFVVLVALSVAGAVVPYPRRSPAFRFVLRAVLVMMGLFAVASWHVPLRADDFWLIPLEGGRWVAVASCALGLWRPSLGIVGLAWPLWRAQTIDRATGLDFAVIDHSSVVQMALLLVLGLLALAAVRRARPQLALDAEGSRLASEDVLLLMGFAFFLRSYFNSGWGKLELDGGPLSWLVDSRTEYYVPHAAETGKLPIPSIGKLFGLLAVLRIPLNLGALAVELGAIVVVFRRRWLMAFAVVGMGLHLAIFLVSGIFFWKYMVVQAAMLVAARWLRYERMPRAILVAMAVVMTVPGTLYAAKLAWYTAPAATESVLYAVFEDGRELPVPSNYFLGAGFAFADQQYERTTGPMFADLHETSTQSHDVLQQALECDLELDEGEAVTSVVVSLGRNVRLHHQQVLERLDGAGRLRYNWFPHHVWSSLLADDAFFAADKREIVAYRIVNRSVCYERDGNRWRTRVVTRHDLLLPLEEAPVRP